MPKPNCSDQDAASPESPAPPSAGPSGQPSGPGLEALSELGRLLNRSSSLDQVIAQALEHLVEAAGCNLAVFYLMENQHLVSRGMRSTPPGDQVCRRLALGECLCGLAAADRRPLYVRDLAGEHRCTLPNCREQGVVSYAGLPLLAGERRVGALAVGWPEARAVEEWASFWEIAAGLLAAAVNRILSQEELERSEERFHIVFHTSPDAVALSRWRDGVFVEVNQGFLEVTGYSRDEVLGHDSLELGLWADPAERARVLEALAREGRVNNLQVNFRLKDDNIATGFMSAKVISLGGERYILSFTRDITALKEAERALRQSEENFRQLAENVDQVFWLRTAKDPVRFLYISPAFEKVWGRPAQDLYRDPRTLLDTILPEDRDKVAAALKQPLGSFERHLDFRIQRPDGSIRWIRARRFPITDQGGAVYRVAGLAQDVTEQRQAKQALMESEDKLAAVINSVGEIMFMVDEDLTVLWANDLARATFGWGLLGARCYELGMGRSEPCQPCLVLETLADGQPHELEISCLVGGRHLDLWGRATVASRRADGSPKSVMVVYRDVTEKKALEAEALRSAHLASIGELAAGVAHEINNPINGIISCAELLDQGIQSPLSPKELISRIIKEGERVAGIVRSLLSLARDSGQAMGPVDLPAILGDCLALIETQLKKDGIVLQVDLPPDLPLVWGNGHQIQQVFLNLMSNARYALNQKYQGAHPDKRLLIQGGRVERDSRSLVRLAFRDQGVGLPPGVAEKVFDPFFSTKPPGQGTGLGLSISHGIVAVHGGELRLSSREGEYTEVVVELPAHGEKEQG